MSDVAASHSPQPPEWDTVYNGFRQAKLAETAYETDVWYPAYQAWDADKTQIPAEIDASLERLAEARWKAEDALMRVPAPDAAGFAFKYLVARADKRAAEGWEDHLVSEAMRFVPDFPRDRVQS